MAPGKSKPRYPGITVKLTGYDANAFFMIARTRSALRAEGVSEEDIKTFSDEAMAGDYDHVLATIQEWVNVR